MIPLFIPYVNRPDLLEKAFVSTWDSGCKTFVIDNSKFSVDWLRVWTETTVLTPPVPLTFSQTQQWMLRMSEEWNCPYYLFLHSDAEAGKGTVEKIIAMAEGMIAEGTKWSVIFSNYDALAVFNTEAFLAVGGWDTTFRWYASECDIYYRLRCAGYPTFESNLPVKHTPSQTLNSDPYIRMCVDMEYPFREAYYRAKHGGPIGHEVYDLPFNGRFK